MLIGGNLACGTLLKYTFRQKLIYTVLISESFVAVSMLLLYIRAKVTDMDLLTLHTRSTQSAVPICFIVHIQGHLKE